ncbi:MAG: hypothetical protein GC155_14320 [Alphaproteobacteria bacterium]|nr:hypothetical protein [Alphaproteobacteria bacterium]
MAAILLALSASLSLATACIHNQPTVAKNARGPTFIQFEQVGDDALSLRFATAILADVKASNVVQLPHSFSDPYSFVFKIETNVKPVTTRSGSSDNDGFVYDIRLYDAEKKNTLKLMTGTCIVLDMDSCTREILRETEDFILSHTP